MTVRRHGGWRDRAWRAAYRLGYPAVRLWWRVRRPGHRGALACIRVDGHILLVRQSYRPGWTLPGGGVRPAEPPEAAARREVLEETGLVLPALSPAVVLRGTWDGRRDEVHVFDASLDRLPPLRLDNREVVEARLFAPGDLPGLRLSGPAADYLAWRGLRSGTSGSGDIRSTTCSSAAFVEKSRRR